MAKRPSLTERPCPHCREPVVVSATRCPHCHAGFTSEEVNRAASASVQGILFACGVLALLLLAVMWWQDRQDAAEAVHLKAIEQGKINPLTDRPK